MVKFYIINLLVIVSISCFGQAKIDVEKLWTLTKVYGTIKYYNNERDDQYLDNEMLKILPHLKSPAYDDINFNQDVLKLLPANQKNVQPSLPKTSPFTQFNNIDHINIADFKWIQENRQLTSENKSRLDQLISLHKKVANTNITHHQIFIHNENIGLETISKPEEYILGLIKLWNVMNYFFPYKNLMDNDWDWVLHDEISGFCAVDSYHEYDILVKKLSSYLNDSHVEIEDKYRDDYNVWKLPFSVVIAEDQMIIKSVSDSLSRLYNVNTGDIIETLEGKSYAGLWQEFSNQVSYSTPQAGRRYFAVFLWHKFNYNDTLVSVTINSNSIIHHESIKTIKLDDFRKFDPWIESSGSYKSINENIGYIKYDNLSYSNLGKAIRNLKNKDYLILDCRGYNSSLANLRLLNFMGNTKIPFAKNYSPNLGFPGVFDNPKMIKVNVPSTTSTYRGKVIVLINERAISAMESVLMAIEARRKDAVFIGSPTQGADGEQNMVILPGNIKIFYSGNNWQYPDGRQFQRIGIQPDLFIEPTIKSFINNEDVVLNGAIKFINEVGLN